MVRKVPISQPAGGPLQKELYLQTESAISARDTAGRKWKPTKDMSTHCTKKLRE